MRDFSGPERQAPAKRLVFAVGSLAAGSGGIAELSRQALRVLRELAAERDFELQVHVLNDDRPAAGDGAEPDSSLHEKKFCYSGRRARFSRGLLTAGADALLFDHVGLARVHGLAGRLLRQPYLLMIHSVEIWNSTRADYRRTAHGADLLIANSAYTARRSREHYPNLPEIEVCWPGKDSSDAASNERNGTAGIGPHALLIVGRLDASQRHKGHDELLAALPAVRERVPDACLVVVGGGDDRARLESRANALGVADAVRFTGHVDPATLTSLYADCALFVMPSEGDGFGMVFLEAMAHGLPCVGLAGSAADEIFEGGKHGALVERDNTEEMAGALSDLLLDEPVRKALGAAGRQRYLNTFTFDHYSQRLKTILNKQFDRLTCA